MRDIGYVQKHVVFIGAAGGVCQQAIKCFAAATEASLTLCDINTAVLEPLCASLAPGRANTIALDLYDPIALRKAIKGSNLVVLGAGPFIRTAEPVIEACLEARIPYLDYDDDVESTQLSFGLHKKAKEAGIPCFINCGASPGMTNIMAIDVANKLDTITTIDVCWMTGHEGFNAGRAILEHLMHISAGPCLTWENGRPTIHESFVETAYIPIFGRDGESQPLHETAHPEPITLARRFPQVERLRCVGGLNPPLMMGIARGLSTAHRRGDITMHEAIDFFCKLRKDQVASEGWTRALLGPASKDAPPVTLNVHGLWQLVTNISRSVGPRYYALMGMLEQVRAGEITTSQILEFIAAYVRGEKIPYRGGLLVRAVGTRNALPAVVIKRTPTYGEDSKLFKNVGTVTGVACAAFMLLALESKNLERSGVFAPEDWVEPETFYKSLERVGVPSHDIIETIAE
jgi:saccharopine dehydrogenase-like NADP-dependent oxidoreductase